METYNASNGFYFLPMLKNDMVQKIIPLPIDNLYVLKTVSNSPIFIRFDPQNDKFPYILQSPFFVLNKFALSSKNSEINSPFQKSTLYDFDFFGKIPGTNSFYAVVLVDNAPSPICIVKIDVVGTPLSQISCSLIGFPNLSNEYKVCVQKTLFSKKSGINTMDGAFYTNVKTKIDFVNNPETNALELRGRFAVSIQENINIFSLIINQNNQINVYNSAPADFFGSPIGDILFINENGVVVSDESGSAYVFDFSQISTGLLPYQACIKLPENEEEIDASCIISYGSLMALRKNIVIGKYLYCKSGGSGLVAFNDEGVQKLGNSDIRGSLLFGDEQINNEDSLYNGLVYPNGICKTKNNIFVSPNFFNLQCSIKDKNSLVDDVLDMYLDNNRRSIVIIGSNKIGKIMAYEIKLNQNGEPLDSNFSPFIIASLRNIPSQEEKAEIEKIQMKLLKKKQSEDKKNQILKNPMSPSLPSPTISELQAVSSSSVKYIPDINNESENNKNEVEEEYFEGKPISKLNEFEKMHYEDSLILDVTARKPTVVLVKQDIIYAITDEGAFVWWVRNSELRVRRVSLGYDCNTSFKPKNKFGINKIAGGKKRW